MVIRFMPRIGLPAPNPVVLLRKFASMVRVWQVATIHKVIMMNARTVHYAKKRTVVKKRKDAQTDMAPVPRTHHIPTLQQGVQHSTLVPHRRHVTLLQGVILISSVL